MGERKNKKKNPFSVFLNECKNIILSEKYIRFTVKFNLFIRKYELKNKNKDMKISKLSIKLLM